MEKDVGVEKPSGMCFVVVLAVLEIVLETKGC